jgi:hypothetical protein
MADIIQIKRTFTAGVVPAASSLAGGELAVNIPDKKMWIGDNGGNPILIVDEGSLTPIASNVSYDNSSSGLSATDVQAAIDEVLGLLNSHTSDTNNPHHTSWSNLESLPADFPPSQHGHDGGTF